MNDRLMIYKSVRLILIRFIEKRLPVSQLEKAESIADQLMIDGEERRDSSQASIKRAKMYLDWLAQQMKKAKVQEQCNFQRSFLDSKQTMLHDNIDEFLKVQVHLTKTVMNEAYEPSVHRAMLIDYIKQCLSIMILQKTIFQREIEISAELTNNVKEVMRGLLKKMQTKDPEKMMTVAQTMKVLNDGQLDVKDIKNLNYQQMNKGLAQFQSRLETRQGDFENVAQAVKDLQEFVKKNQEEFQEQPEELPEKQGQSSSNRMAHAKRLD
jgi:hypothetical protein